MKSKLNIYTLLNPLFTLRSLYLILFTLYLSLYNFYAQAQPVAINITGVDADISAMLDVSSNSKGMLFPRIVNPATAISSPVESLIVYNTTSQCFQYWNGTVWQTLGLCATGTVATSTNPGQGGVAINETGSNPDGSAALDISAANKGVLIPRMNTSQRNAISSPSQGLLIYNTETRRFEFRENNKWHIL